MNRNNDMKPFMALMAVLQTVFDRDAVSEEKITVYFEYLMDLSLQEFKRGVDSLVTTRKYPTMPTVAEIREAALGLRDDRVSAAALAAWSRANTAIITGERPKDDPVLTEAIRLAFGGWKGFGESEPGNEFLQKRFVECYKIAAGKRRELMLGVGEQIAGALPEA